ncbi:hypothetical protein HanPI659440_Chr04g0171551 [Helianthus annuus]|nr:hypothetical protein HanPI659440_Chr04g0171551 [Helianthus annuus]
MRQQGSARRCTPSAIRSATKSRQRTPVRLVAPPCYWLHPHADSMTSPNPGYARPCTPWHARARPKTSQIC